ncbi:MAG TPA: GAF domain-containing protein [Thermoanaerobaculia bacterium]|nr:GAF domain-containing protein [Thermoanaerobaculia bacterium]
MADEPEDPEDEPVDGEDGDAAEEADTSAAEAEVTALAELALCENLSQTSGWAARWSTVMAGADATLLWAPDTVNPLFLCIGASGEGVDKFLRRSAPRETGFVHDLVRDRQPIVLTGAELTDGDPFVRGLPPGFRACLAVPLEAENLVVGLLALFFTEMPDADEALARLERFLEQAAPALGRALRSERKTVGMLHAIERLTNLYDLSKAFGSTIDEQELSDLIVRKAADFLTAEVASLWRLDGEDVTLAATALNENYDVENAPEAVGSPVVGDLLADQAPLRRNRIPEGDPVATENDGYLARSVLGIALVEDEIPVGALVLVNKRGRHPEFSAEDEELLADLSRQAVRALRTARQHEAEKKVEELDALLAVSREITATLDLDKVMATVVNATSALIPYDRCAIGIFEKGRFRLGAVSGAKEIDRKDPNVRRLDDLLNWVFLSGTDVAVTQTEDGEITAERPETVEKFRAIFAETGLKSFFGVLLKDEEGKLGALGFESAEPLAFDEGNRDLLAILVNQATVAVRNAQLYQQVPLAGFLAPLLEKRRKLLDIPIRRRQAWLIGAGIVLVALVAVPWKIRVEGPVRVLPARRAAITAAVEGVVKEVLHREGDRVAAGDVVATLKDESYRAALAEASAALAIAESDVAQHTQEGDAAAMFEARARCEEQKARRALAEEQLAKTLLRAPAAGVLITPHVEQRVGQALARGAELAIVADLGSVTAEVAVPEAEAALVKAGQPVALKMNPYPTRVFRGRVERVGAELRQEGEESFVIAEARVDNPDEAMKPGMLGTGKVAAATRPLGYALFRKPVRYFWLKLWPLLP